MQEFSHDAITTHRFTVRRRKGYDTLQVDGYLGRLAEHVGRMEAELADYQASERAALDVLQQAQHIAAETVAAAERDAEQLRQNTKDGLENARKDARATLDAARAEADKTLLSARVQSEAAVERSQSRISELEAEGAARAQESAQITEELRASAAQSATGLRAAGERLVEIAEHFEFKLATGDEAIDAGDAAAIDPAVETVDTGEERVEIT